MLEIAAGVILGGLGLIAILALIRTIVDNAETVVLGCAFVVGVIALIGVWIFLNSVLPEIYWSRFEWIGNAFGIALSIAIVSIAAFLILKYIWESRFITQLRTRKAPPASKKYASPEIVVKPDSSSSSHDPAEQHDDVFLQAETGIVNQDNNEK